MNIKGPQYETQTETDAVAWITRQAGKEMKRCVFPTRPCLNYYISRDGLLFGCRHMLFKKKYVAYMCHPKPNQKADGIIYDLSSPDGSRHKLAARLIWCTWVLGYWSEKVKVRYRDGDPNHLELDNLVELNNDLKIRDEHAETMHQYEDIYRREFKMIVHDVRYKMNIEEEDAKDAVQEAYIAITRNHDGRMEHFGANWMVYAQKIAISQIREKEMLQQIDYKPIDRETGRWDNYNFSTILGQVNNDTDRCILQMVAEGASLTEISQELGISRTNVENRLNRARQDCKAYLLTDREIMKIYG